MKRLNKLNEELAEKKSALNSRIEEVRASAQDEESSIDDVKAGMAEIEGLKADIEGLSEQIKTLSDALDLKPEEEAEEAPKEAEKSPEDASEGDEKVRDGEDIEPIDEPEEVNSADDNDNEETRSGKDINNMEAQVSNTKNIELEAFNSYMRNEEVRDGLTTVSGEAVVPTQILQAVKEELAPNVLKQYVNRQIVGAPSGKLPVVGKASAGLVTKAELAKNPDLEMSIADVKYDVETFAGRLPISQELLGDAVVDIDAIASQYIQDVSARTEQRLIIDVLKTATKTQEVATVDDLKTIFNVLIPAGYQNKSFVLSQTLFNTIDQMKDADGRFLLQDSIASATGKALLGAPVYVVDDELMGAGAGFVGDLKSFVLDAVRKEVTVKWQDFDLYGRSLAIYLRADVVKAIDEAGVFIPAPKAPASK